jgi:uncharacterized small protein (DUF1192 family)
MTVELLTILGMVASLIISITSAYLQFVKYNRSERPKLAADAAGELTDTSLALVTAIRKELEEMKLKLADLQAENAKLKAQLAELEDVRTWAERLVHQIRSLGHEPVPMKSTLRTLE